MSHKKWWVQGVISGDDGNERGRYSRREFRTKAAARRFTRRLYRDNTYPGFWVDTNVKPLSHAPAQRGSRRSI